MKALCRKCGVEMTLREARKGDGYCYVCAAVYGPVAIRRPFDEAVREMQSEGAD